MLAPGHITFPTNCLFSRGFVSLCNAWFSGPHESPNGIANGLHVFASWLTNMSSTHIQRLKADRPWNICSNGPYLAMCAIQQCVKHSWESWKSVGNLQSLLEIFWFSSSVRAFVVNINYWYHSCISECVSTKLLTVNQDQLILRLSRQISMKAVEWLRGYCGLSTFQYGCRHQTVPNFGQNVSWTNGIANG